MAFAQLSNTDKSFLNKAARGNNYEIQAAKLAQTMSTNDAYKTYAQMIIDDHTQAAQSTDAAVSQADPSFQLPTGVSPAQQTEHRHTGRCQKLFRHEISPSNDCKVMP